MYLLFSVARFHDFVTLNTAIFLFGAGIGDWVIEPIFELLTISSREYISSIPGHFYWLWSYPLSPFTKPRKLATLHISPVLFAIRLNFEQHFIFFTSFKSRRWFCSPKIETVNRKFWGKALRTSPENIISPKVSLLSIAVWDLSFSLSCWHNDVFQTGVLAWADHRRHRSWFIVHFRLLCTCNHPNYVHCG